MSRSASRRLAFFVLVCGLAFALRIDHLGASPLRGDEAFAVRYWAADPLGADPLGADTPLSHREPHPFGTFGAFWAWNQIAGSSEFAMRLLPLLGNLLGVAGMWALARWLFHDDRAATLAALLWAIHPFLIWHAQDARNYALWAGLSPLAMLLFVRAAASSQPRRWAFYVAAQALALYTFFLEAFLLPVQILFLLLTRSHRDVWRRTGIAGIALGVLLVPWLVQLYWLSGSGYSGTLDRADPAAVLTTFLPTLLVGDALSAPWNAIVPLSWIALVALLLAHDARRSRTPLWLSVWIVLPTVFLLIVATRMSVFNPRYLIAVIPALLLLTARALTAPIDSSRLPRPAIWLARVALVALLVVPGADTLARYYRGDTPKAPDWPTLAAFFMERAGPTNLIVFPAPDPTFRYYYTDGPAAEISLEPGSDPADTLDAELWRDAIWLVGDPPDAMRVLDEQYQRLARYTIGGFPITYYATREVSTDDIAHAVGATFGDFAHLVGYTLHGPSAASPAITLSLYWLPLAQTQIDYKVFVHLTSPRRAPDGSPIWAQDDRAPGTTTWDPNALLRDPYTLLADATEDLPPGDYTLEIGVYDPATGERVPVAGPHGDSLGDTLPLATVHFPVQ
ncbi:glycosyltransferase family 39 protein [Aggregatilinea lenta]|uniref:glycosyltransferase family 39 protein n=1 Tax=Aggregatilinea lenta TaxID=913108 RepID=UPI0013C34CDA|nr:glycosyltransferase family 39 protein [Aggregatilinea lenta]